jgi:hypothetical protein
LHAPEAADQLPIHVQPERPGRYPLTTRLRDGSRVTLDEADLAPLVQRAIDRAEDQGATVTLLLCAGGFHATTARGTLVRPFEAAVARLQATGARHIAIVLPFPGQADAARRKWEAAGFAVTLLVGELIAVDLASMAAIDAIVLDYVGHAPGDVAALRRRTRVPVVDLGEAGADAACAAIAAPGIPVPAR